MLCYGGTDGETVDSGVWVYSLEGNAWILLPKASASATDGTTEGAQGPGPRTMQVACVAGDFMIVLGGCNQIKV